MKVIVLRNTFQHMLRNQSLPIYAPNPLQHHRVSQEVECRVTTKREWHLPWLRRLRFRGPRTTKHETTYQFRSSSAKAEHKITSLFLGNPVLIVEFKEKHTSIYYILPLSSSRNAYYYYKKKGCWHRTHFDFPELLNQVYRHWEWNLFEHVGQLSEGRAVDLGCKMQ